MEENIGPKALAEAVVRRRAEKGIQTQRELAEWAGLSPRLVGEIENGRRKSYRAATLANIDSALSWETGSSAGLLERGESPKEKKGLTPFAERGATENVWLHREVVDVSLSEGLIEALIKIPLEAGDNETLSVSDLMGAAYDAREAFQRAVGELRARARGETSRAKFNADELLALIREAANAESDAVADYADIAHQKAQEAFQSDYRPAASPHEQPDPHNGVGEENQDESE